MLHICYHITVFERQVFRKHIIGLCILGRIVSGRHTMRQWVVPPTTVIPLDKFDVRVTQTHDAACVFIQSDAHVTPMRVVYYNAHVPLHIHLILDVLEAA